MRARRWAVLVALAVVIAACSAHRSTQGGGGTLVLGVHTDPFGDLVNGLHITVWQDGAIVHDATEPIPLASQGNSTVAAEGLTVEVPITGAIGARVEATIEALPTAGGAPIVSRKIATRLVPDPKKLLRIPIESRCLVLPGWVSAAQCDAPLTCVAGACASIEVGADQLEEYQTDWVHNPPDLCRPANHGPPEVIIGTGQTDYQTLADDQMLQMELGPQGGHHIWIASRMRNLRQSGSTTSLTSSIVDDPAPVVPTSYVFTYDRDEGGYCKLSGLRYQLDAGDDFGSTYKRFLGKRLAVTVEVVDSTGARASSTKTVRIADKLLCPDGTDSCNL
jgi:hypothetical protein